MDGSVCRLKEKRMRKGRSIAAWLTIGLLAAPAWTQVSPAPPTFPRPGTLPAAGLPESLSCLSVAERLLEIASETAGTKNVTGPQVDQAIILLTAARSLSNQLTGVEPLLLRLATCNGDKDYAQQVTVWLPSYVSASADRTVVSDAIRYLLDRTNSREERIELLGKLASRIGNKNPAIDSELATLLGLLMVEKGDTATAKSYLAHAYANNKYNKTAFAKLAELVPSEIGAGNYAERLRLALRENPLDLSAALSFAQCMERLQLYDVASSSYRYGAELFRYLYPSEPLPPYIYLPWAISCYNTDRDQPMCLQIAENVRSTGRFDILLEAVAGRAAAKAGRSDEAQGIFGQAEQKARQLLQAGPQPSPAAPGDSAAQPVNGKQLAWFYCFASPNPPQALDWANKAYSAEPNSPAANALLAYALSLNNQLEWAKPLLPACENGQIADLVQARIQLSDGKKEDAIRTLRMAVTKDPGSLAAERAKATLQELGAPYTPPVDIGVLRNFLTEKLGRALVPQFLPPDRLLDVQFSVRGNTFSYGSEIEGSVAVTNRSAEPLVITPDSLFQGNIRISARASGVLQQEIPDLISQTIRTDLTIPPGRSLVHTLRLSTGPLRRLLLTYPQASLEIQFTLYLDPIVTKDGSISNRLVDIKPVTLSLTRPGIEVTAGYVRDRYNTIASGQEGQKIQTARLFTGLLKEQCAMAEHGTLYPFRYAAWLPQMLRSGLLTDSGLLLQGGENEWVVKVNTMVDMLGLPIDQELATAVAKNLNHPKWPVRLMAVYLLATSAGTDFGPVLDWVVQNDANEMVRGLALSFQPSLLATRTVPPSALRMTPPVAPH
jgi:tetratricopeptide (TPR) repeat protein